MTSAEHAFLRRQHHHKYNHVISYVRKQRPFPTAAYAGRACKTGVLTINYINIMRLIPLMRTHSMSDSMLDLVRKLNA
jgi:hypothetical protein